jgi:hypothetical protein
MTSPKRDSYDEDLTLENNTLQIFIKYFQPFIIPIANPIAALPVNGIPRFVIVVVGNIIGAELLVLLLICPVDAIIFVIVDKTPRYIL